MKRRLWPLACRSMLLLAAGLLTFSAATLFLRYTAACLLVLLLASRRNRRWRVSASHGSARPASLADLNRLRMTGDSGLILGRMGFIARVTRAEAIRSLCSPFVSSERACRMAISAFLGRGQGSDGFIRANDFIHLATFAPAGGGMSVSVLIPNLLSYLGNCFVVDPKGELFEKTAEHRRKRFGHRIVRLDPAGLKGPGADCFNPFDWIDPHARDFIDKCRDLANMIVMRTGLEPEPHFPDSAENVIAAFIAYICACEGNLALRNLRGMREHISLKENYEKGLSMMQSIPHFGGVLQELGSVMSTTMRNTHIFASPLVEESTGSTTFDPRELRTGRMTVYLIVPGDRLVVWAALLRVWLGVILRIVTEGVPTDTNPVLFMCDETAHIGRMRALEDAVTLLRGAGIRLWLFFQSIDQMNKCFGDNAGTVLDNLATQQYFAINSYETAETLSKRIGMATIAVRSTGDNAGLSWAIGGDGGNRSTGNSVTISETGRRMLLPEEVLVLHESVSMVFHRNSPVIFAQLIKYFSDPAFSSGGTRKPGLGLRDGVLALAALLLAIVAACFVASIPVPGQHRHGQAAVEFYDAGPVEAEQPPYPPPLAADSPF